MLENNYLTTLEVARRLGITRDAVIKLVQRRTLPAHRVGLAYLVPVRAVEALEQDPGYQARTRRVDPEAHQQALFAEEELRALKRRYPKAKLRIGTREIEVDGFTSEE